MEIYVVATPIGNLKDISLRALKILKEVDFILCEDTRVTKKLLDRYQIHKPLISYHQHSRLAKINFILQLLREGKNLALVSDSGTPGISDPGNKLIGYLINQLVRREGAQLPKHQGLQLSIVPIPGPSAVTTALSISGFPADKFVFFGFPPQKKGRQKFFQEILKSKYTAVFYESPHRLIKTLEEIRDISDQIRVDSQEIVVCRELTKKFETIYRGTLTEVLRILQSNSDNLRGEFVIVI